MSGSYLIYKYGGIPLGGKAELIIADTLAERDSLMASFGANCLDATGYDFKYLPKGVHDDLSSGADVPAPTSQAIASSSTMENGNVSNRKMIPSTMESVSYDPSTGLKNGDMVKATITAKSGFTFDGNASVDVYFHYKSVPLPLSGDLPTPSAVAVALASVFSGQEPNGTVQQGVPPYGVESISYAPNSGLSNGDSVVATLTASQGFTLDGSNSQDVTIQVSGLIPAPDPSPYFTLDLPSEWNTTAGGDDLVMQVDCENQTQLNWYYTGGPTPEAPVDNNGNTNSPWQLIGSDVNDKTRTISGSSLTPAIHGRIYVVVLTGQNAAGEDVYVSSTQATLNVEALPRFTTDLLPSYDVQAGDDFSMDIAVEYADHINWYKANGTTTPSLPPVDDTGSINAGWQLVGAMSGSTSREYTNVSSSTDGQIMAVVLDGKNLDGDTVYVVSTYAQVNVTTPALSGITASNTDVSVAGTASEDVTISPDPSNAEIGNLSISSAPDLAVATATLSGNVLTITGVAAGTTTVEVTSDETPNPVVINITVS